MKSVAFIDRLSMRLRSVPVISRHIGDVMTEASRVKRASNADPQLHKRATEADLKAVSLDELSGIARNLLMDKNLEAGKIRPFFWTLVEAYVERFQVFPFDAVKALFKYLEFHGYREAQLRELIRQLEELYEKQHGDSVPENNHRPSRGAMLDEEITELRETLKYAAIAGERIESFE